MKEMEAKTENRYEYRKPQEKRKQMIAPDLFEFAYVPDWYGHLAELERLALPESWKFRKPSRETKNADTPILERYIHTIFRKQVIDFNSESDPRKADSIFHLENECVCFHTGLYTPQYKGIYGYFERNNFSDSLRDWYFRGFCDELSPTVSEDEQGKAGFHQGCGWFCAWKDEGRQEKKGECTVSFRSDTGYGLCHRGYCRADRDVL